MIVLGGGRVTSSPGTVPDSMPTIVWTARPDGTVVTLDAEGARYTGLTALDLDGDWTTIVHVDDVPAIRLAWRHARATSTASSFHGRLRRSDGEYRWHALSVLPVLDEGGCVRSWIGAATDVHDARSRDAELRSAHGATTEMLALLENLMSKAPVGLGLVDRDLCVVRVNEAFAALSGHPVQDHVGRSLASLFPELWPTMEPLFRQLLETGLPVQDVELDTGPADGDGAPRRRWLVSCSPLVPDVEVVGIGVIVVDVTERLATEAARWELAAIVDGSADAIFGVTVGGIVSSWNAAAERLFGYRASEIIGRPVTLIAPDDRADEQAEIRAKLLAGGRHVRLETVRRRKDGSLVDVIVTASTTKDASGAIVGLSVISHDITARREEQRALETGRRRLAEAQRIAQVGSFEYDVATEELTWSAECCRILGVDPAVTPTMALFVSMLHPDDRRAAGATWVEAVERAATFDLDLRITRPDGELRLVRSRAVPELGADGRVAFIAGTTTDETERVATERVRREAETRFEIGFEQAGIGAAILDLAGLPTRVNTAVCAILGRTQDELIGQSWADYSHPEELPIVKAVVARLAAGHDDYSDERRFVRPDGSVVWALLHITLVRNDAGHPQYYLAQLQDVTVRNEMQRELAHQAMHDTLTGLPNRALLTDRLVQGLAGARRRGTQLGVMFIDVDHFKLVNDSFGHDAGDDLLRTAAERIGATIRPGDTMARLGGDEFVIVCDDVSAMETEQIADRVLAALGLPWTIGHHELFVTASLGIAISDDAATPDTLLRDADTAMYRAKQRGRGRVELFDEALRSKAARRLSTASAIRHALERDEFGVHYQPVVDLTTGAMTSVEALLRWEHPGRGTVHPIEFIPIAEESGLIVPIGAWLLERACADVVEWQRIQEAMSDGTDPMSDVHLTVAVNLSVRQVLAPDIGGLVEGVLQRTGLHPADLCLELTESVFMEDIEYFERTLRSLKALGVDLAIDDFGTGYSSLSYLKRFPVDAVKIDKAFVDGLGVEYNDTALVAAIVAMARALGLHVTAEGVETRAQLAELKRLEVPCAQGFLLSRPVPAATIAGFVASERRWRVD